MHNDIQVLIVGAGPTGLSMALELHRHQIPFRIIDKKTKPIETSNALGVQPRTLEVWDDQDLITTALELGFPIKGMCVHSNRKIIAQISTHDLETFYPYVLALPQFKTEQMLIEYLEKQNIKIEFEVELTQITERIEIVNAIVKNKDGSEGLIRANWLIACDGIHSTVREALHMPFEGQELHQHFMMGDVVLNSKLAMDNVQAFFHPKGAFMVIPYGQNKARILFDVTHNVQFNQVKKPSDQQLQEAANERSSVAIRIEEVLWKSGFRIQERIISNYKHNNIFFVGDAAHVHSPAGGQGMNTGIQDVYNLAWKLAAVIKGQSPFNLLDSYHQERYPVAKDVLFRSSMLTRLVTVANPAYVFLRNTLFKFFIGQRRLSNRFINVMSQLAINYEDSRLTKEYAPNAPGPKAGDRFLDCYVDTKKVDRLLNYVRGTKPSLLFFSGILKNQHNDELHDFMSELQQKYGDMFNYILVLVSPLSSSNQDIKIINDEEQIIHRKYEVTLPFIYLIRPDKYLGFRGKLADRKLLEDYLVSLFTKS